MASPVQNAYEASFGTHVVPCEMALRLGLPTIAKFEDLPVKPITSAATTHFTMVVSKADGVAGIDVGASLPNLLIKLQEGKVHEAGPCLGLGSDMPILDFQIVVIPDEDNPGAHTVIKMVHFPGRVHRSQLQNAIRSDLCIGDMTKVPSLNRFHSIMQLLFRDLGGHQIVTKEVVVKPGGRSNKKLKTNEEHDAGFAFIRENGPRSNNRNQFVEWTEKHISTPESPIYQWDRGLVKESLRNYAAGDVVAPEVTSYPLTLADFKPWITRDFVVPCLSECTQKGVVLHGLSELVRRLWQQQWDWQFQDINLLSVTTKTSNLRSVQLSTWTTSALR